MNITRFKRLLREKGFVEPFSLFANKHLCLIANRGVDECLQRLLVSKKDDNPNPVEYTLRTEVRAPAKGKRIGCIFFVTHHPPDGFSIHEIKIEPPVGIAPQSRKIRHNSDIPTALQIAHMFPQLKKDNWLHHPFSGRGRR